MFLLARAAVASGEVEKYVIVCILFSLAIDICQVYMRRERSWGNSNSKALWLSGTRLYPNGESPTFQSYVAKSSVGGGEVAGRSLLWGQCPREKM